MAVIIQPGKPGGAFIANRDDSPPVEERALKVNHSFGSELILKGGAWGAHMVLYHFPPKSFDQGDLEVAMKQDATRDYLVFEVTEGSAPGTYVVDADELPNNLPLLLDQEVELGALSPDQNSRSSLPKEKVVGTLIRSVDNVNEDRAEVWGEIAWFLGKSALASFSMGTGIGDVDSLEKSAEAAGDKIFEQKGVHANPHLKALEEHALRGVSLKKG